MLFVLCVFIILILPKGNTLPAVSVDDSWRRLADMPTPRFAFAAVAVGGRLYALGGSDAKSAKLSMVEEYDPPFFDTDGDERGDDDELRYATDPLVADVLDVTLDTDNDGLLNLEEVDTNHSSPIFPDTDNDGLADREEVEIYGTSSTEADTDGDDLTDREEVVSHSTNPTTADTDGDGISDGKELAQGANPLLSDTDSDLFGDGIDPLLLFNNLFIILPGLGIVATLGAAVRNRSKRLARLRGLLAELGLPQGGLEAGEIVVELSPRRGQELHLAVLRSVPKHQV